ncbi:MAG TPA: TerB family tellurite resistance protein [Thermohalobaculum sp.]|nr:TerB family tellurite resistance protein [Thermohalobaculum sp.]
MIDWIARLLEAPEGERATAHDERAALAALLVEAARADGAYDDGERARIDRVLATRFAVTEAEARALRAEGEAAQAEAIDLVRFTRAVKDHVPHGERLGIIEALWEVVYADGRRDMHESALMRSLAGLLHVADRDVGLVRQQVAKKYGIE